MIADVTLCQALPSKAWSLKLGFDAKCRRCVGQWRINITINPRSILDVQVVRPLRFSVCPLVCPSFTPSVSASDHPPAHVCICARLRPSVSASEHVPGCCSVHPSFLYAPLILPCALHSSVRPPVRMCAYLSVHVSVHLSFHSSTEHLC